MQEDPPEDIDFRETCLHPIRAVQERSTWSRRHGGVYSVHFDKDPEDVSYLGSNVEKAETRNLEYVLRNEDIVKNSIVLNSREHLNLVKREALNSDVTWGYNHEQTKSA